MAISSYRWTGRTLFWRLGISALINIGFCQSQSRLEVLRGLRSLLVQDVEHPEEDPVVSEAVAEVHQEDEADPPDAAGHEEASVAVEVEVASQEEDAVAAALADVVAEVTRRSMPDGICPSERDQTRCLSWVQYQFGFTVPIDIMIIRWRLGARRSFCLCQTYGAKLQIV